MSTYTAKELRGADLYWLMTVTVAGRVFRFASGACNVDEARTGATHSYSGRLVTVDPPRVEIGDGGDTPQGSASVSWVHPSADGWAALDDADDLSDATGELALWVSGLDYASRQIVVAGRLEVTSYGDETEPVEATLYISIADDLATVPPVELVATEDRWPRAGAVDMIIPEDSVGTTYPMVVGAPGYDADLTTLKGWPVYVVELDDSDRSNVTNAAVVLIHAGQAACVGATVRLYNLETGLSATVSVTRSTDKAGAVVSIATVAAGTLSISEGQALSASALSLTPVGVVGPSERAGGLYGAGDVVRWLLMQSTTRIDFGAMDGDLEALNQYRVDGIFNVGTSPLELVKTDILPIFPCGWYVAPDGIALRAWPRSATEADCVARIGPDYGCERVSGIEPTPIEEVYHAFRIEYGMDMEEDAPKRSISLVPDADPLDATQVSSPHCRPPQARGGIPPTRYQLRWAETLSAELVSSYQTAFALVNAQAERGGHQRRAVDYDCPQEYQAIQVGSPVWWVRVAGGTGRVCRVMGVTYGLTRCIVTLETL